MASVLILYKKETWSILNSPSNFAVHLDPRMTKVVSVLMLYKKETWSNSPGNFTVDIVPRMTKMARVLVLYKNETWSILNSPSNFVVHLDPRMTKILHFITVKYPNISLLTYSLNLDLKAPSVLINTRLSVSMGDVV